MRYAAGQLTQAFQPLGLLQLGLQVCLVALGSLAFHLDPVQGISGLDALFVHTFHHGDGLRSAGEKPALLHVFDGDHLGIELQK